VTGFQERQLILAIEEYVFEQEPDQSADKIGPSFVLRNGNTRYRNHHQAPNTVLFHRLDNIPDALCRHDGWLSSWAQGTQHRLVTLHSGFDI
jgi:hypothetical protein